MFSSCYPFVCPKQRCCWQGSLRACSEELQCSAAVGCEVLVRRCPPFWGHWVRWAGTFPSSRQCMWGWLHLEKLFSLPAVLWVISVLFCPHCPSLGPIQQHRGMHQASSSCEPLLVEQGAPSSWKLINLGKFSEFTTCWEAGARPCRGMGCEAVFEEWGAVAPHGHKHCCLALPCWPQALLIYPKSPTSCGCSPQHPIYPKTLWQVLADVSSFCQPPCIPIQQSRRRKAC